MKLLLYCQNCHTIQEQEQPNAKVEEYGHEWSWEQDRVRVGKKNARCVNCGSEKMNLRQRELARIEKEKG